MTQSLTWTREGDKLVLVGELDQDVLNPLWDARIEAMKGGILHRSEPGIPGRYRRSGVTVASD
ncbi:anti-sigma factor antagonist [Citrobacter freundii]|nr:anti-sigma factor antagonist [Citrobacter freundii]